MSNYKNSKKNNGNAIRKIFTVLKTQCLWAFLSLKNWIFYNKRAILQELRFILLIITICVLFLQFIHIYTLTYKLEATREGYEMAIVQIRSEHEEEIEAHKVTIQYLQDEVSELNDLNLNLQNDVDELNKVIKIIADRLNVPKEKILNSPQQISRGGGDAVGQWMTFEATAYTKNCYKCSGITKTGINLHNKNYTPAIIAADPKIIPLGSTVEIQGIGIFKVEDTGGKIKNFRIDILHPTKKEALEFGRQSVQLRILKVGE